MKKIFKLPGRIIFKRIPDRRGFSLVEMLMALLIASLLLAALAPVITKKFNDNLVISGLFASGNAPSVFKCWDYDDPELQYADDGSGLKVLPEDYPIEDAWSVNFILASGGGGGAGATASKTVNDSYKEPEDNIADGIKIEHNMTDFEIELMVGAGGGGGGGAEKINTYKSAPNSISCKQYGLGKTDTSNHTGSYETPITTYDGNGLCVTSYNQKGSSGCITYSYGSITTPICSGQTQVKAVCTGLASKWSNGWRLPEYGEISLWSYSFVTDTRANGGLYAYNRTSGYTNYAAPNQPSCCRYPSGYWSSTPTGKGSNCGNGNRWKSCNLIGAQWECSGENGSCIDSLDYISVRCVLADDIEGTYYYSFSGGGGGAGASISSNNFDSAIKNKLIQRIKENIDGYIVLSPGNGGEGGDAATAAGVKAKDGTKGGDSCILIKDSAKVIKYALCVPGGNGGKGADATNSNYTGGEGYGTGGGEISATNACYTIDYTTNPAGVKTTFNCTAGSTGGGQGEVVMQKTAAGGKGGASINNPSVQASNSGQNGVTPDSKNNPGAGGGGGTGVATERNTSISYAYGNGGNGAKGYIKLNFKRKYEAAGGGGGGGGYLAHIKKVNVGKSATCSIKVGYGGTGGAAGADGQNGGESSITCSSAPNIEYKITGGKGGTKGVSASESAALSTAGYGGKAGTYVDKDNLFTRLFRAGSLGFAGADGKDGGSGDSSNYKIQVRSAGGGGGNSGTGERGGCGGLYNESGICLSVSADENNDIPEPSAESLNGKGFSSNSVSIPTFENIKGDAPTYGSAGAGGGGGAWYVDRDPGSGGNGQAGYVCIYWEKIE